MEQTCRGIVFHHLMTAMITVYWRLIVAVIMKYWK